MADKRMVASEKMREMMEDCMNEIQTNGVKLTASGILTGFSRLDYLTGGLENGIKAFDLEEAPF